MTRATICILAPLLFGVRDAGAQNGCRYPGPCLNPVPAIDFTDAGFGNRLGDDYGEPWTISSNVAGNTTGSVYVLTSDEYPPASGSTLHRDSAPPSANSARC